MDEEKMKLQIDKLIAEVEKSHKLIDDLNETLKLKNAEIKRLKQIIEGIEKQKNVCIGELESRDNLIEKVKSYMGQDNFNNLIQMLKR